MATRGVRTLEAEQGRWAVGHARQVVDEIVESGSVPDPPERVDPVFETERGAFVTLKKGGELRGCIGRPEPEQSALEAIRDAAADAATDDPRFPPVGPAELDDLTVEVSILTAPTPIEDTDRQDIPEAITIGEDGLIVRAEGRAGLLLPQVPVDQGWEAERFLAHTCRKAGLEPGRWLDPETEIERFSAQVFAETEPYGPVEAVPLTRGEEV